MLLLMAPRAGHRATVGSLVKVLFLCCTLKRRAAEEEVVDLLAALARAEHEVWPGAGRVLALEGY